MFTAFPPEVAAMLRYTSFLNCPAASSSAGARCSVGMSAAVSPQRSNGQRSAPPVPQACNGMGTRKSAVGGDLGIPDGGDLVNKRRDLFAASGAPVTAGTLLQLLAQRHAGDVFVPECKTGPTWTGNPIRLDAWAMKRSWASPVTWGYEIKVSRGDFLRDDKWHGYLDYCSDFYLVCPPGLILANELPPGVGLINCSTNAKVLYTRVKAVRREVQTPRELLVYVLMSRSQISKTDLAERRRQDREDYWREWLAKKSEDRDLGEAVGKAIRQTIEERIKNAERENRELREVNEGFESLRRMLASLDMPADRVSWYAERRVREVIGGVPTDFLATIRKAKEELQQVEHKLGNLLKEDGDEELQEASA
jgi:hypothetical protein